MTDLISRLGAATVPSRELDAEIAATFGLTGPPSGYDAGFEWPRYTESIDATVTLVAEDHYWIIVKGKTRTDEPMYGAQILWPNDGASDIIGEGENNANAAIALVIAILKSRE